MRQKTHGGSPCEPCSQCNQTQIQPEFTAGTNDFKGPSQKNSSLYQLHQVRICGKGRLANPFYVLYELNLPNSRQNLLQVADILHTDGKKAVDYLAVTSIRGGMQDIGAIFADIADKIRQQALSIM